MASELISDAEIAYIAGGIIDGVRSDGRGCYDFRPVEVELDVVAQASGSARVHLGTTDVLVGVRVSVCVRWTM
jgi:exosome complex component RRP42